jgi:NADH-quinone oxidoreductase subunit E
MGKTFSQSRMQAFQHMLERFPNKQSALMNTMRMAEEEFGYLDAEACTYVAHLLDLAPAHVYGCLKFYFHFKEEHHGTHRIMVCSTLMCAMRDSKSIVEYLQEKLGIGIGEKTADGKFSIEKVECLAACHRAPVMQIDDKTYYELTPEKIDTILEQYK